MVITAGIPEKDGCPILTRLMAFIVDQGVISTLEHTMRDRRGNPIDLSAYLAEPQSESDSESVTGPSGSVVVRFKEWMAGDASDCTNPVYEFDGSSQDPESGVIRTTLNAAVVSTPGIYEVSWGIQDADANLVAVNSSIMSVERTLFGRSLVDIKKSGEIGPPTINEIRMWMMDSAAGENTLLDDVEFNDEQIMLAMTAPVRQWNESPPPIRRFNTKNFPFRGAWSSAILAQLYKMAAAHYRRNFLKSSGGGLQIEDKNKEREYLAESIRLQQEYDAWLINKKVECNVKLFAGANPSIYSALGGW